MNYRPDIDGLRAIAVLTVVFYHAHLGCPGGYVGVDVFFVISGYLITRVILTAINSEGFSFLTFWERRILRLIPALALVTAITTITSFFVLLPVDLTDLGGTLVSLPLMLSNVYLWSTLKAGYFGDPPEVRPLLHTWSLGVEEQFYILWPLLLRFSWPKSSSRARTLSLLGCIALASLLLSSTLTLSNRVFAFFLLPTRSWELILGGMLACVPQVQGQTQSARRFMHILGWVGLGLIGYSSLVYTRRTPFPGTAAILPCLGATAFLWANSCLKPTSSGKFLSTRIFVTIGQISYSLYLWHWPLIAWGDYMGLLSATSTRIGLVLISLVLSYASWRWIETPFRKKRWLATRLQIYGFFLVYATVSLGIGVVFRCNSGFPGNWSDPARRFAAANQDRSSIQEVDMNEQNPLIPSLGDTRLTKVSFLLWGDSHAMSLGPLMNALSKENHIKGLQLTHSAMAPLAKREQDDLPTTTPSSKWSTLAMTTIEKYDIPTVFMVARWQSYASPTFAEDLNATIGLMKRKGVAVVLVCDVPQQHIEFPPRALAIATRWPALRPIPVTWQEHKLAAEPFYSICDMIRSSGKQGLTILDPAPLITGWDDLGYGGKSTYVDDHHLTDHGALMLRALFEPVFRALRTPK